MLLLRIFDVTFVHREQTINENHKHKEMMLCDEKDKGLSGWYLYSRVHNGDDPL